MSDAADQYPERKRRARHAAAPDGVGPVAYARGSDRVARPAQPCRSGQRSDIPSKSVGSMTRPTI